jgi:hypothetical protein
LLLLLRPMGTAMGLEMDMLEQERGASVDTDNNCEIGVEAKIALRFLAYIVIIGNVLVMME